jgi:ABC-type cobalamin/Fe3+-siderophores transport system ATPase subunit
MARSNLWNRARKLLDASGQPYLTSDEEAKEFLECLRKSDLYALEGIASDDRPVISLTLEQDGKFRTVPFEDLSFGQKSSILLGILLFSKATAPLVIDQPEDHLDSQFIYEAVVGTLRRIKEQRQVIIATHNANIAVLGDAELILPLRSWQDRGVIADRGSVDTVATRDRACRILEGGDTAYRRRGELYGFRFDST